MRKIILFLLVLHCAGVSYVFGNTLLPNDMQVVQPSDDIKTMFENEQYNEIIARFSGKPRTLSASELTYVAMSYFHTEDLENATIFTEMAEKKDPKYAPAYYVESMINSTIGDYSQALDNMQTAITLSPDDAAYHVAVGDIYYAQEKFDQALENYNKAVSMAAPAEKGYYMIGASYSSMDKTQEALDAFYAAKSKIVKDKELYVTVLYNIGSLEYNNGNYSKAQEMYKELTEYFPDDYYSYEKLVQCSNALGDYAKAKAYKERMYDAHSRGLLATTSLSDMFCIDNFTVDTKTVSAYERYEEPTGNPLVKNIFYVSDNDGNIESTVFLEYTPSDTDKTKGRYHIVVSKDSVRYSGGISSDSYISYDILKPYIVEIVKGGTRLTPIN